MWKLNSILLNHELKKQKKKERKCFEMNENENNIPKLMGFSKAILREALYFVNAYVISKKASQINNPD